MYIYLRNLASKFSTIIFLCQIRLLTFQQIILDVLNSYVLKYKEFYCIYFRLRFDLTNSNYTFQVKNSCCVGCSSSLKSVFIDFTTPNLSLIRILDIFKNSAWIRFLVQNNLLNLWVRIVFYFVLSIYCKYISFLIYENIWLYKIVLAP